MTNDARRLSAEALLSIPADEPERIFPRSEDGIKKLFRELAGQWHPDRCADPRADAVFSHVKILRDEADKKYEDGSWTVPGVLALTATDGKAYELRYGVKFPFELGMTYIGQSHVTYVVDKQYADLFENGVRTLGNLPFASDTMKVEMARTLPVIKARLETTSALVLVVEKQPAFIRLRDLLDSVGGKFDPKHVAWTLSNLYNTACYLRWAGLTHNEFSIDTVFVSPQHHGGAVPGGWWYAAAKGSKLQALPTRSVELAPSDVLRSHIADARVDLELIRAIGRELLGDPSGSGLSWNKEVPKPLADWLRAPTSGDALTDYKCWRDHVLPGSFGPSRFVKWDINLSNLYRPRSM
jgi:hypothetical protein